PKGNKYIDSYYLPIAIIIVPYKPFPVDTFKVTDVLVVVYPISLKVGAAVNEPSNHKALTASAPEGNAIGKLPVVPLVSAP
ncbi:hypothetical protein, partial [Escherichia coli]|uniref:hypothetical protein n=1 Tax=Escherichia coli TaxID=562 RepID=UPI001BC87F04